MKRVGNKMKKLLLTASLLMLATQASAWVSKDFVPNKLGEIRVTINDNAQDGCWTNIGEVKRYAKDKLELLGYDVSNDLSFTYLNQNDFDFFVNVLSARNQGTCYGVINLAMARKVDNANIRGEFTAAGGSTAFLHGDNVNQYLLEVLGDFFDEMKNPQFE